MKSIHHAARPAERSYTRKLSHAGMLSALLTLGYLATAGCSSSDPLVNGGNRAAGGSTGSASDPSRGAAGSSTSSGGSTGISLPASGGTSSGIDFGGSSSGPTDPDACASEVQTAELQAVDMYIMLDKSGSMWQMSGAVTKWTAVKEALVGFFNDPQSAGLGVGMQYFPLSSEGPLLCEKDADCAPQFQGCTHSCALTNTMLCTSDADCLPLATNGPCMGRCSVKAVACTVPPYATDAVAIAELPGNAAALTDSINAQKPAHSTPTLFALSGAHERAKAWAASHPDHRVAVLFATDGVPQDCDAASRQFPTIIKVAEDAYKATPSVETYVIGVFEAGSGAKTNLDKLAAAGGTDASFIVDQTKDVKQQFLDALAKIRGGQLTCDLKMPNPPSGQELDLKQVNVTLKNGTETQTFAYVADESACTDAGGWHYDKNPDTGAYPTKIVLCPKTCEQVKTLKQGELGLALGCRTVVR